MPWYRLSLQTRILIIVLALTALSIGGALASLWFNHRLSTSLPLIIDHDLAALEAAEELNAALVNQKGFLSYFFQDEDPTWLSELRRYEEAFRDGLGRAWKLTNTAAERAILTQIEAGYAHLTALRDQVLDHFGRGQKALALRLLQESRQEFNAIRELCLAYKSSHQARINQTREELLTQAGLLDQGAMVAIVSALLLGSLLLFVLLGQVLGPIRRLADETAPVEERPGRLDEVKALSSRVRHILEDADETKTQLQLSRKHLLQASKLASVGKLAAGVAHSIRNPLTSVKMRLFSLERSLKLSSTQREDLEVISEEIRHIDNIVRNFLEFSRRPKLKVQRVSPSAVVDQTLDLLRHRFESYGVQVLRESPAPLPELEADPEQLKEVLVNLITNACEALAADRAGAGLAGSAPPPRITVAERLSRDEHLSPTAVLVISDNGPGVPVEVADKVFQPFFTTKEEGTGLGLSIAARIVEEHGGRLALEAVAGGGARFVITLPLEGPRLNHGPESAEEESVWTKF